MRKLRWIALVMAIGLALLGTAGCGRLSSTASKNTKNPTIGVTVYDMTSFITLGKQGVDTEAKSLGANVLWRSANNDVNTQDSQIQSFINQKVDAIVVAAVNASTLGPQLQAAQQAGIPVFGVNLALNEPAFSQLKAYVGPDDVAAGSQEAKYLAQGIGGQGGVVIMQGPIGSSAEIDRTKGINQELSAHPGLKANLLSSFGSQINGVIAENDDMAIGAIQALTETGKLASVKVVGIDGIQDGMKAVQGGQEYESNLQDAPLELGMGLVVAVKSLRGEAVPQKALLKMPPLTKDTVTKYYDQMYGDTNAFLQGLPALIDANLASGDYAKQ
jgi:ribose transport system substrate-binding protein